MTSTLSHLIPNPSNEYTRRSSWLHTNTIINDTCILKCWYLHGIMEKNPYRYWEKMKNSSFSPRWILLSWNTGTPRDQKVGYTSYQYVTFGSKSTLSTDLPVAPSTWHPCGIATLKLAVLLVMGQQLPRCLFSNWNSCVILVWYYKYTNISWKKKGFQPLLEK